MNFKESNDSSYDHGFTPSSLARNTDPETSHAAAESAAQHAKESLQDLYEAFVKFGAQGLNDTEAHAYLESVSWKGHVSTVSHVRERLRSSGIVLRTAYKRPSVGCRRPSIVWKINPDLPHYNRATLQQVVAMAKGEVSTRITYEELLRVVVDTVTRQQTRPVVDTYLVTLPGLEELTKTVCDAVDGARRKSGRA